MLIKRKSNRVFEVEGKTDIYQVWIDINGNWCCSCPFASRKYTRKCKHIKAVINYIIEESIESHHEILKILS